jgi:hypothetical protein
MKKGHSLTNIIQMKFFGFLLIFSSAIYSCSTKTSENSYSSDTISLNKNVVAQTDTNKVKINTGFPFGAADLAKYKYPHYWEEDHERYGPVKSPEAKKLSDISTLLHTINNAKVISSPFIKSIEYLDLNERYKDDSYYFDTLAVKSLDSCIYRLPDIKNYQCYYFRQHTTKITYGEYGSLLFLEPSTRMGKLLTLYFEYGGEQNVTLRYYLIDKDTINIYDGYCYDDGTTLTESFKIFINPDAKIEIMKIKK